MPFGPKMLVGNEFVWIVSKLIKSGYTIATWDGMKEIEFVRLFNKHFSNYRNNSRIFLTQI